METDSKYLEDIKSSTSLQAISPRLPGDLWPRLAGEGIKVPREGAQATLASISLPYTTQHSLHQYHHLRHHV